MNFRPSAALGRVSERTMITRSITNRAGMPILLNCSMPLETPPCTITMQMMMNSAVNTTQPRGVVSIAPKTSPPLMATAPLPKDSLVMFRAMYCRQ